MLMSISAVQSHASLTKRRAEDVDGKSKENDVGRERGGGKGGSRWMKGVAKRALLVRKKAPLFYCIPLKVASVISEFSSITHFPG